VKAPRSFFVGIAAFFVIAVAFVAPRAEAQGKAEAPAKALQKKAMEEDYLTTEFAKAADKLDKAIKQCGDANCGPALRAALRRDLGVVQIGGQIDKEKGIQNFVEALKIDPKTELDKDLRTKELDAAFADAKKRVAGGGGGAAGGGAAGGGGGGGGAQPAGDFTHEPAAEQQIRTPIPVYVEYGGETPLVRVIVRYKGFGMTEWKTSELKKMGDKGWGGLLPCADVQQGTTQYYIQGFDSNNDPVATAGDRNNPYKVKVSREPVADPPHLPNASPPTQCADTGDCPPNFPGCKTAGAKPPGEKPEPTGKDGGEFCEEDSECKSHECKNNKCTDYEGGKKGPKIWVGVFGALDYTMVPSADDVCKLNNETLPVNGSNYYCVQGSSTDYPSRTDRAQNDSIVASSDRGSDKVSGGGALGNIRVMLSMDYAINGNFMIGGRVGLVLNRYPGEAAGQDGKRFAPPVHAELRGTYVLGKDALYNKGFAPYFFGGAGLSSFETKVDVKVVENVGGTRTQRDAEAWHLAGPGFLTAGGGGRFAFTPKAAAMFGLRLNLAFGDSFAPSVGPEVGVQIGF
jgi:hypothetical protein